MSEMKDITPCKHPEDRVRFLTCTAADRFPGMWVCDACGIGMNFDPTGKSKVRYLEGPNPAIKWKTIEMSQDTGKG